MHWRNISADTHAAHRETRTRAEGRTHKPGSAHFDKLAEEAATLGAGHAQARAMREKAERAEKEKSAEAAKVRFAVLIPYVYCFVAN